jgi:hypothetical protein
MYKRSLGPREGPKELMTTQQIVSRTLSAEPRPETIYLAGSLFVLSEHEEFGGFYLVRNAWQWSIKS